MELTAWPDTLSSPELELLPALGSSTATERRKPGSRRRIKGGLPARWPAHGLTTAASDHAACRNPWLAAYELALFGAAILAIFLLPG